MATIVPQYFADYRGMLYGGLEATSAYPHAIVFPAVPSSPAPQLVGFYENLRGEFLENTTQEGGTGSPLPLYNLPGVRRVSLSFTLRLTYVGSLWILANSLIINNGASSAGSFGGLPDLVFSFGAFGSGTEFRTTYVRFCKIESARINYPSDARPITADVVLQGLAIQPGAAVAQPAYASVNSSTFGVPLQGMNMTSLTVGADDYVQTWFSAMINIQHTIVAKPPRPDAGDTAVDATNVLTSRIPRALLATDQRVTGELVLTRPPSWGLGTVSLGDIVHTTSNVNASTAGTLPTRFVFTGSSASLTGDIQETEGVRGEMHWRIPWLALGASMTIANS